MTLKGGYSDRYAIGNKYRKQRKEDPLTLFDPNGVISMMKNFDQMFLKNTMQILQICHTQTPGLLKLWVRLPSNLLYSINLKVDRRFYVNSKTVQSRASKVSKTIPRSKNNKFHLYEIVQDEKDFIHKYDSLMNYHLSHPHIDAVYETQIPLEYKVILELGSVIKPKVNLIKKNESALSRIYQIKELSSITFGYSSNPFRSIVPTILLYHSCSNKMHFFGVFIPDKNKFMLVTSCPKTPKKELVEIRRAFSNAQKDYQDDLRLELGIFDFENFKKLKDAVEFINEYLRGYKNNNKTAFVCTVFSPFSTKRLISMGMTTLEAEVPVCKSNILPEEYSYPALDWAYFAVGHFCQRCVHLNDWFKERYSISQYSFIPLGNFTNDNELQIIDVQVSRALQKSNYVLWYSDTKLPDLGGKEDCDAKRFLYDQLDSNIEISNQGFYRTY